MAVIVETIVIAVVLLANAYNVASFRALSDLFEHLEQSIEGRNPAGHVYPAYGVAINALIMLCIVYHSILICFSYRMDISFVLQLRWEVVISDFYSIHLVFLLLAIGRSARQLRRMLQESIVSNRVADVCAVLRLRDDLLRSVALVNRCYGVFFLGGGVTWAVYITGILYFDFVLQGVFILDARSLGLHTVMFVWKSVIIGGLLTVAGTVMDRVNEIMQATYCCETHPSMNRGLTKMLDKALLKCQFQDIRFTVYGLLTIDNSLSYAVTCSIVTYLVILVQFRQMEEQSENNEN
ncbi:gustatory and pheromone receptor 39a-like [Anopheles ziemanni]|uniref:gustatory and pheromone receptor 39a-like n=1 Tax=Anopheles coustani TaxID=139045 RepID=UPI00265ADDCB|nr:gustatory and pheromone receptor 39a-like [Anopheles coustani]XP_058177365.1 gustatory and pheromone receptor 39a-like [Anopheles ziemanni]